MFGPVRTVYINPDNEGQTMSTTTQQTRKMSGTTQLVLLVAGSLVVVAIMFALYWLLPDGLFIPVVLGGGSLLGCLGAFVWINRGVKGPEDPKNGSGASW